MWIMDGSGSREISCKKKKKNYSRNPGKCRWTQETAEELERRDGLGRCFEGKQPRREVCYCEMWVKYKV